MSDPTSAPASGKAAKPLPNNLGDTTRRRWACDRCHAQKLRCLRTINAEGGDCDRCIRVSATCGYSPPGRMGRPARSDSAASNSAKRARDSSTSGNEPSKRQSPTPPTPPRSHAREPSADSSIDVPLDDLLLEHSYPVSAPADTTFFPLLQDPNPFMGMVPDMTAATFTPDSPNSALFAAGFNPGPETFMGMHDTDKYVRELITLSLSQYEQFRLVERSRELTGLDKEALFTRLQGYPIGEMLENAQKLTSLIESFLQASRPRENSTGAYWNEFLGPLDLGKELVMDPEPMSSNASTDGSVMDFSDAWNMMPELPAIPTPNTASSISSGGMPATNGLGGKKADTSTTLLVLSCYIRLARLYILFFADLHCFLLPTHQPDPASSCDRRLFPGLKLGSFQPFAGTGLEISMVVQVSEHMLSRLHKALGLSSGDDSDNGSQGPNGRAWNWTSMEMITPVLMRAVQAQEGLDAQDEKGDTASQLGLAIDGVKRLLRARAFL